MAELPCPVANGAALPANGTGGLDPVTPVVHRFRPRSLGRLRGHHALHHARKAATSAGPSVPPGYGDIPAEPGPMGVDCLKHAPAVGRPAAASAFRSLAGPKVLVFAGGAGLVAGGGAVVGGGFGGGGSSPSGGGPASGGGSGPGGGHTAPGGSGGGISIPEPASIVVMALALAAMAIIRLRRNR